MDANSEPYLLAFAYASDFPSFPGTKLIASDRKWQPGIVVGADIKTIPRTIVNSTPYWYANNANPAGVNLGKAPVDGTFSFTCVLIDAVLPYLFLGKATKNTPSSSIWQIQGSTDGSAPDLAAIVENNQLYALQTRQFENVRFVKGSIVTVPFKTKEGEIGMFIAMDCNAIARREYTGTAANTYDIDYRGTYSPEMGYNIYGNTVTGFAFTWNAKTLTNWIAGIKSDITNDIGNVLRMDNNLHAGIQANGGKRKFGKPTFKFLQKMVAAGDLDDMETYRDSTTKSDIVLKVPRRNASDYLTITWKDVYLLDVQHEPTPKDVTDTRFTYLTFSEPTDIIFNESTSTNGTDLQPEADADFEQ